MSSSLLLFPQRFSWYVLRPSSGVCRTREPSQGPSLSGTCSSFQHLLSNCNCSIGGPEGPICSVLVLSTATYLQMISTSCHNLMPTLLPASVTISHSIQPLDSQGYILIFLDWMHLLFTQVHFLFWQLSRVGGQYTTVMVIVVGNGHGNLSSNPGWGCLHFL